MSRPGFIKAGLEAIGAALETAAEKAGLITRHVPLTRAAARAFRARLKELETLLRRLLVVMAADLGIERPNPPRPHPEPVEGPAQAGTSSSQTAPSETAMRAHPEGACPGAGRGRRTRTRTSGFILVPVIRPYDPDALARLNALPRRAPRPIDETPLVHRLCTLRALLADPAPLARRMARRLARLKAAGESKPVCLPQPGVHRFDAALGALAMALPLEISAALSGWYDTG